MKPYFLNLAGRTKKALDERDSNARDIFKNSMILERAHNKFQDIYEDLLKEADKGNTYHNVLFDTLGDMEQIKAYIEIYAEGLTCEVVSDLEVKIGWKWK